MKRNRNNKGQSLVEWALVLPLFIILTFGLVDFGFMMSKQHSLNHATKVLARAASVGESASTLESRRASLTQTIGSVSISYSPALSDRKKGENITVQASYTYIPITPVISKFGTIQLESTSQTIVEYVP